MTMQTHGTVADVTMTHKPRGIGLDPRWLCLHCGQSRVSLGSRGVGLMRRCGPCVAARNTAGVQNEL